jgi:hypothetical protein
LSNDKSQAWLEGGGRFVPFRAESGGKLGNF